MKFNKTTFGSITGDGNTYNHDIYLFPDKNLEKRDKSHSKQSEGHRSLSVWELYRITQDQPDFLIIGKG